MADVAVNFTGKVCGANLTSKPGAPLESAYWLEWDWAGWIRKQVQYAQSLGANTIRLIGDVTVVNGGSLTQGQYNTRTQQLVAYCVQQGLGVYYTGCATYGTDGVDNGTVALSDATIAGIINSNVVSITSGATDYRQWIIGADIVQEANANMTAARVNNLYSLIKSSVPSPIGCTFSTSAIVPDATWIASIAGSLDYLDYHIYPQVYGINAPPSQANFTNGPRTTYPTKDLLIGEFGCAESYTTTQVSSWLSNAFGIGNMADSHMRGGMWWSVQDQDTVTSNQYGAFNASWVSRAHMITPIVTGEASAARTRRGTRNALRTRQELYFH